MKKLIFAIAILTSVAFASCTKENVAPVAASHKATVLADKGNLGQADFNGDSGTGTGVDDKGNLGQADDKGNLGQADANTGN